MKKQSKITTTTIINSGSDVPITDPILHKGETTYRNNVHVLNMIKYHTVETKWIIDI